MNNNDDLVARLRGRADVAVVSEGMRSDLREAADRIEAAEARAAAAEQDAQRVRAALAVWIKNAGDKVSTVDEGIAIAFAGSNAHLDPKAARGAK